MSKHTHHQSKAEQIDNKAHGTPPFHYDSYQTGEVVKLEDIQTKGAEQESSIKLRAYQIHLEKGGSDFDNWLEAERSLSIKKHK
jgi:hypothetical protein